jgi:hypothetical protein
MPNHQQPTFSILHTSVRPNEWEKVYRAWLDNAHDPDSVEYVLVVDHDWGFTKLPTLRTIDKVMWAQGARHCYVDGVNRAAAASTGGVLIVNADDQYPCENWDEELLNVIGYNADWGQDFIILPSTGTPDEHIRRIAVMPILSRTRYEKYGHVLYPLYESMFSDNDFLAVARKDGVVIEAKHLMFPHMHPLCQPNAMEAWANRDEQYRAQNRDQAYAVGNAIFQARQNSKFTDQPATVSTAKPLVVVCLPGESFAMEWMAQWTETLCSLSTVYRVLPIFSYTTNVYTTRESLAMAAADAKADYIVWIDDDNIVAPGQIQKLIEGLADADMTAGWCWLRSNAYDIVDYVSCGKWDGDKARPYRYSEFMDPNVPGDMFKVGWSGFPVVAMRGDIFSKLPKHPFLPILSDSYPYGHAGEDVSFCRRVIDANLSIFVDRTVKVPHLKRKPDEPAIHPAVPVVGTKQHNDELVPA